MSIGLVMMFRGVNTDKYDAIMKEMGLSGPKSDWPEGIVSHVVGKTREGMCVVDVWQSQAQFDKFFASRLQPAFTRVGGMPEPQLTTFEVHNSYRHG